jgi:hypothetical protein
MAKKSFKRLTLRASLYYKTLRICNVWIVHLSCVCLWRHDIQQNDIQHNDNQHNDIQHNDTQHNYK